MKEFEEVKADLESTKGRTKTGRTIAQIIIHSDLMDNHTNYEIVDELGLKASAQADVSKARSAAKQLKDLGYTLVKES